MPAETNEQTLLERVEGLSGGDREVDDLIWWEFFAPSDARTEAAERFVGAGVARQAKWARCFFGEHRRTEWTSDVSAAIALGEKCIPDALLGIDREERNMGFDNDMSMDEEGTIWTAWFYGQTARAPTPALALIAAILKARAEALKEEG